MLTTALIVLTIWAQVPAPQPFKPHIEDPMLTPAPRASTEVKTWDEALIMMRTTSTDDRVAEAAIRRAEGRWRQSLGALLPNAKGSASLSLDLLHPSVTPLQGGALIGATAPLGTVSAGLTQTLVDLGAWRGLDSADLARESSETALFDVRRRLTLGLAKALVAVVTAERVAEINRLGLQQALERVALIQRTQQLGAATQVDVVRVLQDAEVARFALIGGDEQLLRTREALGTALGVGHEIGVVQGFVLDGLVAETEQGCTRLDYKQRPDVEAARQNADSATAFRRQASAGYLPTLGVASNVIGYSADPGGIIFPLWSISAVLSVPIWEGGTREGLVEERRGQEEQAQQAAIATERNAELEAMRSRRGIALAEALLTSARTARAQAVELDTLTRKSFEAGRGSSLELVQSAQALRIADQAQATREYELVQARLDAYLTEASCDW